MDFQYIGDGINAVVIDNFYTKDQLKDIMLELKWLTKKEIMLGEEAISTAENEYGSLAKKSGIFLENVFINWRHSSLIRSAVEQLESKEFLDGMLGINEMYKLLFYCNHRSHLLSYYQNADYYEPHIDASMFTILNYFTTEPKQWEGGEMVLSSYTNDKEATIEIINNRVIIITSNTYHAVKQIKANTEMEKYSGNGRYCNSIFMTRVDNKEWAVDPNGGAKYIQRNDVSQHQSGKNK
jgi:hypothetical protein